MLTGAALVAVVGVGTQVWLGSAHSDAAPNSLYAGRPAQSTLYVAEQAARPLDTGGMLDLTEAHFIFPTPKPLDVVLPKVVVPAPTEVKAATQVVFDGAVIDSSTVIGAASWGKLLDAVNMPAEWRDAFTAIARCESGFSPYASGDRGNSLGLLQINVGWFHDGENPYDPATNLIVGMRIRAGRGRFGGGGGWTCADALGIY